MEVLAKSHQSHGHCCGHEHGEGGSLKNTLLLLGGALILTVAAASAPFPETVRVSVFGVAYLLAGEVLLAACRNIFKGEFFDENFLMTVASVGAFAIGEMPEDRIRYDFLRNRRISSGFRCRKVEEKHRNIDGSAE